VRAFGATRTTVDLYRRTKKKSTLGKREKKIFDWLGRAPRAFLVAAVHCEIELDMRPLIVSDESGRQVVLGERDTIEYYRSVLSEALAHDMHHLVVAANIAAPCGLEAGEGVIVMGDEFARTTESLISNLWAVVELSNTTGWSPVRSLPLASVLDWTTRYQLSTRMGDSAISRAYNALTYLFDSPPSDDPLELFWALMGVEALFSEGALGVMDQVVRRSQLLIGRHDSFKKKFGRAYSVRSSFVHGGMPFPGKFTSNYGAFDFDKFKSKVHGASTVAAYLLVRALQELVVNNWSALQFELTLTGRDLVPS